MRRIRVSDMPEQHESPASANSKEAEKLREISAALRALADPTRLRIFLLLRQGETCVCEIASELGLADNLVSHHLAALRRAELVIARRDRSDARWVYYRVNPITLTRLSQMLGGLFDQSTLGSRTPICGPAAVGAIPLHTIRVEQQS